MIPYLITGSALIGLGIYWHVNQNRMAITYMGVPIGAWAVGLIGAAVIVGPVIGSLL